MGEGGWELHSQDDKMTGENEGGSNGKGAGGGMNGENEILTDIEGACLGTQDDVRK